MVIGDIVGHDLQAAARMAQVRNMLRALAWDTTAPPSTVLARLDGVMAARAAFPEGPGTSAVSRSPGPRRPASRVVGTCCGRRRRPRGRGRIRRRRATGSTRGSGRRGR
ncbi:SpoIIE family protein phosphatase [Spirillospora sp. NPDC047418]